jgi:hypothetical protein
MYTAMNARIPDTFERIWKEMSLPNSDIILVFFWKKETVRIFSVLDKTETVLSF